MADYDDRAGMQIGDVLKSTRTRQGLDIRTVEERTKIRIKYLRALENEDWEVLPSAAYVKGFLRAYGQLLGLDADALVDEYRRRVEVPERRAYPVGEPVLERRRRLSEPPEGPRLGAMLGIGAAVAVVLLLVLGLTGGTNESVLNRAERLQERQERQERRERRRERRQARQGGQAGAGGGAVRLRLVAQASVRICLLDDGRRPLIDGQVVPAGTVEVFEARRFQLRFPSGYDHDQLRLFLNGERRRLPEASGPAAYRIGAAGRVRRAPEPGPGCP